MSDIVSEPFFTRLCEVDKETSSSGEDVSHSVVYDEAATIGLSVDKYFVTIIRHDVGEEKVSGEVYMSVDVFEKLYKLYVVHKEGLNVSS